jgi:hypothetical protein
MFRSDVWIQVTKRLRIRRSTQWPHRSYLGPSGVSIRKSCRRQDFSQDLLQRLLTEAGTPIHLGSRALNRLALVLKDPGGLIFSLELNRAECEFLTGQLTVAEERLAALSNRATTTVEQAALTIGPRRSVRSNASSRCG